MLRGLYNWTMGLAGHRHALWALAIVSFAESSIFPIPPDILMIPMILARPNRAFLIASVCLIASVLGGLQAMRLGRCSMTKSARRFWRPLARPMQWPSLTRASMILAFGPY